MKMAVDLHFCIKMEVEFINICFELLTITDVTVEPFFMEIKVGGDVNFSAFLIAPEHLTLCQYLFDFLLFLCLFVDFC